jgi:hypothetical protein
MAIPSRPQTFGLENCQDLLRKLEWEVEQLKVAKPGDPDAIAFGVFNGAVTAWHLTDWVWQDMPVEFKAQCQWTKPAEFQNYCRDRCRALHVCRQIATASKHSEVMLHPDPTVITEFSASATNALMAAFPRWKPLVMDGANKQHALDTLIEALVFWSAFIVANGIAR